MRRHGRLGCEINLAVPTASDRLDMIRCLLGQAGLALTGDMPGRLAAATVGYVASDLELLVSRLDRMGPVTWDKVMGEVEFTTPSGFKSGLGCVRHEKVSWDSVGGLKEVKTKLRRALEGPLKHPEAFTRLGIKPSKGLLLYGPPGNTL